MRWLCAACAVLAACNPFVKPPGDGGTGGGSGGGGGGGTSTGWVETPLTLGAIQGGVDRLAPRGTEIWALIAEQYVSKATGSLATSVFSLSLPRYVDLSVTPLGGMVLATEVELNGCTSVCENPNNYGAVATPDLPLGLCVSGEVTHVVIRQGSGARVFAFNGTDWNADGDAVIPNPGQCVVDGNGRVLVAGLGGAAVVGGGVEVPDVSALGRTSAQEQWVSGSVGPVTFIGSAQGAIAKLTGSTWTAQASSLSSVRAIAVRNSTEAWAIGPGGLAKWDGSTWTGQGGPSFLAAITAVAVDANGVVYLGGTDSTGAPRVLHRP